MSDRAKVGRCDTVKCQRDNECYGLDCDDGYCLSWDARPQECNVDPKAPFFKCNGLSCRRDSECHERDCENGVCLKRRKPIPSAICEESETATANKCPFVKCDAHSEC